MGDIILKANNQPITQTDDLKRIIMFSGSETVLTIEREGKTFDISFNEIWLKTLIKLIDLKV